MKKYALAAIAALSMGAASATTITFDQLEQAGTGVFEQERYVEGNFVTEGVFLFSAQQQNEAYAGSASMFNIYGGPIRLSRTDSRLFSLTSMDLAPLSRVMRGSGPVEFVGEVYGGGSVTQTFTINDNFAFSTFHFSGFTNLVSVSWLDVSNFQTQFDNIVAEEGVQVPEPGSLGLLGIGVIGAALARRRPGLKR